MDNIASIVQQLQQERACIDAALQALTGVSNSRGRRGTIRTGRTMSAAARRRIAAAQRARWAKWKAANK